MSEFGAGITLKRKDGKAIEEAESSKLVDLMNSAARKADKCGAFDYDGANCDLAWENEDGSITLVATSSPAYKGGLPEELEKESMEEDIDFAKWLTQKIEEVHKDVYSFEVEFEEW